MREVFIEFTPEGVVVYRPGTFAAAATFPTIEEALALARAEWPDLGIRVILSRDVRAMVNVTLPKCAHCG